MARAIVQRWPVKQEYREAIINRLARIAIDPASSPREATAAAKAVIAAESQNQRDEQNVGIQSDRNRFLEIAERLGIRTPTARIANGDATGSTGVIDGTVVHGPGSIRRNGTPAPGDESTASRGEGYKNQEMRKHGP